MLDTIPSTGCPKCGYGHYAVMDKYDAFEITFKPRFEKIKLYSGASIYSYATQDNEQEYLECVCNKCKYTFKIKTVDK